MEFILNKDIHKNDLCSKNINQLKNFLKLPLAHRWVCYEWFYSDVDKAIFEAENDFQTKIRLNFPELKTFQLTKLQWRAIRRALGKPRRHSQAFFWDSIRDLNDKRSRVSLLQRKKISLNNFNRDFQSSSFSYPPLQNSEPRSNHDFKFHDLPQEIPSSIVVGTQVLVRMRKPYDGLFEGTINAIDQSRNSFRVLFANMGACVVDDFNVASITPQRMINIGGYNNGTTTLNRQCNKIQRGRAVTKNIAFNELLLQMTRLNSLIKLKESAVSSLRVLNCDGEVIKAKGDELSQNMLIKHSVLKLKLSHINDYIKSVINAVNKLRCSSGGVSNGKSDREMILHRMVSILSIARECSGDRGDYNRLRNELDLLRDKLDPENYDLFNLCVEQHFLPLFR